VADLAARLGAAVPEWAGGPPQPPAPSADPMADPSKGDEARRAEGCASMSGSSSSSSGAAAAAATLALLGCRRRRRPLALDQVPVRAAPLLRRGNWLTSPAEDVDA
jgi:hypothetical protein